MTEEEFWDKRSQPSTYDERLEKRMQREAQTPGIVEFARRPFDDLRGIFQDFYTWLSEKYPTREEVDRVALPAIEGLGNKAYGGVTSMASRVGEGLGKVGDAARKEYVRSMVNNYHGDGLPHIPSILGTARTRAEDERGDKEEKMGPPAPKRSSYGGLKNSPLDPNQGLINRETGEILRFEDLAKEMAANQPPRRAAPSELSRGLGLDIPWGRVGDVFGGISEGALQYLTLANTREGDGQVPASLLNTQRRDEAGVEAASVKASAAEAAAKARIDDRSYVNAAIARQTPEDQELLIANMGTLIDQFEADFDAGSYGSFGQTIGGDVARSAAARQLAEANRWVQLLQTNEGMRKTITPTQAQKHLERILSGQRPITPAQSIGAQAYGDAGTAADEQGFN